MPTNDLQFFGLEIFRERNVFIDLWALSVSVPPENIRKRFVSLCFQGV